MADSRLSILYREVLYNPYLIVNIVSWVPWDTVMKTDEARIRYLGIGLLQICKRWTQAIHGGVLAVNSSLVRATEQSYIPAIPAIYYDLMTLRQKIIIPNYYFTKDIHVTVATSFKEQYRIQWGTIVDHCEADRELAAWALASLPSYCGEFTQDAARQSLGLLFGHFEAFRTYVARSEGVYAYLAGRHDKLRYMRTATYGLIIIDASINFKFIHTITESDIMRDIRAIFLARASSKPQSASSTLQLM